PEPRGRGGVGAADREPPPGPGSPASRRRLDPRWYQIAMLSALLGYGVFGLDFDLGGAHIAGVIGVALGTQFLCTKLWRLPTYDPLSALISGIGLCTLLRTNGIAPALFAAALAIGSKFVLRWRGKHLYNPTNLALVVMLIAGAGWISPGQYGHIAFVALLMVCLGLTVVCKAARSDVTLAFLGVYAAILFGRSLWLGEPMTIPIHRLQSGLLLQFAFNMISDPRTTPDSRRARLLFGALVAVGAGIVQFVMFRTNGTVWSLAVCTLLVPLLDRWLPGPRHQWKPVTATAGSSPRPLPPPRPAQSREEQPMKRLYPFPFPPTSLAPALLLCAALWPSAAHGFCGFYVASGDAKLFNKASQVALVRDGDRTVMTMANDFRGEPKEFAIVIPVPTVLEKGHVHVGDKALIDHLDAFSAPRLVEYWDPDPCPIAGNMKHRRDLMAVGPPGPMAERSVMLQKSRGVTIEAQYTVGEYDILILSARESNGLELWLSENGYRIPAGASRALAGYIKQGVKFFVAKVNLAEQKKLGFTYLRPIQVAFESPKFMLPIRLGMVNADGPQELFVYAISRKGRVETVNYRIAKLPSDQDVPEFVKTDFADFYRDMFSTQVRRFGMEVVFTEYAWDMGWCDPCASEPLSAEELKALGVFWLDDSSTGRRESSVPFLTRLHVRYDAAHFPEDLVFQETADRANFQGRFVIRHEWKGDGDCPAARTYRAGLAARRAREAGNVAELTGWELSRIRGKMAVAADWSRPEDRMKWWDRIWKN
ncbi:MAG: DUF2330 domain-containing protein, partial [Candidatus Eiseniibacteriota bacterium]